MHLFRRQRFPIEKVAIVPEFENPEIALNPAKPATWSGCVCDRTNASIVVTLRKRRKLATGCQILPVSTTMMRLSDNSMIAASPCPTSRKVTSTPSRFCRKPHEKRMRKYREEGSAASPARNAAKKSILARIPYCTSASRGECFSGAPCFQTGELSLFLCKRLLDFRHFLSGIAETFRGFPVAGMPVSGRV